MARRGAFNCPRSALSCLRPSLPAGETTVVECVMEIARAGKARGLPVAIATGGSRPQVTPLTHPPSAQLSAGSGLLRLLCAVLKGLAAFALLSAGVACCACHAQC